MSSARACLPRRPGAGRGVAVLAACLLAAAPAAADPSRDVLWVALQACLLAKKATGRAFPCLTVDPGGRDRPGSAVLRAPGEPHHLVVMPTDDVPGLEAPVLRGPRGAAYWRAALLARPLVSDGLGGRLPVVEVGLAVNSAGGRSQDQLHIHVGCLRPRVLAAVAAQGRTVRAAWTPLPALPGGRYLAMRVGAAEADAFNPFAALARLPGRGDLRRTSFAAVAASPDDPGRGFVLMAVRGAGAHAEELMDHGCAAARTGPKAR